MNKNIINKFRFAQILSNYKKFYQIIVGIHLKISKIHEIQRNKVQNLDIKFATRNKNYIETAVIVKLAIFLKKTKRLKGLKPKTKNLKKKVNCIYLPTF